MLEKYESTILKAAKTLKVDVREALGRFILNLCTMRDQFEGFENVNFRLAGQEWNKLKSSERNALKNAFLSKHADSKTPSMSKGGTGDE